MWTKFKGTMARRLLVNWRIERDAAIRVLPPTVRPTLVNGWAIAGLCLVRLEQLRPARLPAWLGHSSENVAVRMGVEWDEPEGLKKAVLILRRDTASSCDARIADVLGFGLHGTGKFTITDKIGHIEISMESPDGQSLHVTAHQADALPSGSAFHSLSEADHFFGDAECGYSRGRSGTVWHGARLHLQHWKLCPMSLEQAQSTIIEDLFGAAATLDSAFIMRHALHTWSACGTKHFASARGGEKSAGFRRANPVPRPMLTKRWGRSRITAVHTTPRSDFDRWF